MVFSFTKAPTSPFVSVIVNSQFQFRSCANELWNFFLCLIGLLLDHIPFHRLFPLFPWWRVPKQWKVEIFKVDPGKYYFDLLIQNGPGLGDQSSRDRPTHGWRSLVAREDRLWFLRITYDERAVQETKKWRYSFHWQHEVDPMTTWEYLEPR